MKRSLLLSTLLLSLYSLASITNGSIEFYNDNEHSFYSKKNSLKITDLGFRTNITKNGLTIGTNLKFDDFYPQTSDKDDTFSNFINNSKIYAKYEKSFGDTTTSLKISFNPNMTKNQEDKNVLIGDIKVKGKVELTHNDLTAGFSSKTVFPFKNCGQDTCPKYGTNVFSKHDLYLNGDTEYIKDIDTKLELYNSYSDTSDSLKYLCAAFSVSYSPIDNLKLDIASNFKYQFNDDLDFEDIYTGTKRFTDKIDDYLTNNTDFCLYQKDASYFQSHNLGIEYTGLDKFDFKINNYVNHLKCKNVYGIKNALSYGDEFNTTYTPIDNLTLTAYTHLGGVSLLGEFHKPLNIGLFEINLGTKYDYYPIDEITLSPSLNVATYFGVTKSTFDLAKLAAAPTLELDPRLEFDYTLINKLNITASAETPITFTILKDNKFGFHDANIKTSLDIKYEW